MILEYVTAKKIRLLQNNPHDFWENITEIGELAFAEHEISEIAIPDTVTKIGEGAFTDCQFLTKVKLSNSIDTLEAEIFSKSGITYIEIPSSVKRIELSTFAYCDQLKSVKFNEGLEYIGRYSFSNVSLSTIKFPNTIRYIDSDAFANATNLKSIELPDRQIKIESEAFRGCINLKNIKIGENTFSIKDNETFNFLLNIQDKYVVCTNNKDNDNCNFFVIDKNNINKIENINEDAWLTFVDREYIEKIIFWDKVKQKSPFKSVQKAKLPPAYIIEAIGKNEQLINAYYETKSNGISILEKQEWFKSLTVRRAIPVVQLFVFLGGFENNASYQKQVIDCINNLQSMLCSNNNDYWQFDLEAYLKDLPEHFDCLSEKVTIYAHDKENNIIMENGFPKIKAEKTVKYNKQFLALFEKNMYSKNFLNLMSKIIKEYPKIYKAYRKKLAKLNPDRNIDGNKEQYEKLKQKGVDLDFVMEYFSNKRFLVENQELSPVIYALEKNAQNQSIISVYDKYLTEAKQITQNAIAKNSRTKVFVENIKDSSTEGYTYFWPPITSAVALTIGSRFSTCYAVNELNEPALISVLTNPKDWILIINNEYNEPIAYCRVNYDEKNKGILIDIIELDKNQHFNKSQKVAVWDTCVRALKDMQKAMNEEGKYLVERINCKPDPFNRVFEDIYHLYPFITDIGAVQLEERYYTTDRDVASQEYYADYEINVEQIVIDAPELHKENDNIKE